jgi:excinuclease ABC subunit A
VHDKIIVKGARENNLKNISFDFPKNKLVVFTGVSGSGKSSMAFDTLFAEGQRRYVESLSSYARQFLGNMKRPDVDLIEGLSPSIAINQKAISHNPRSTVGTVTEIYDYLRLLFARVGHPHCPQCGKVVKPQTSKQIATQILEIASQNIIGSSFFEFRILAPLVKDKKGDFKGLIENLRKQGFKYARVDEKLIDLYEDILIFKQNKHTIEVQIDKVSVDKKIIREHKNIYSRLIDSVEQCLKISNGLLILNTDKDILFSENLACPHCNISIPELEPRMFSFNSPQGACPRCKGLGKIFQIDTSKVPAWKAKFLQEKYFNTQSEWVRGELDKIIKKDICPDCLGSRLNKEALSVTVDDKNIFEICSLPIEKLNNWLDNLNFELEKEKEVFNSIYKELNARVEFLLAVGLDYLSIEREAGTLSSGESQRIRLASQIGTGLTGVLYILDEPTIGLHSRDNDRLIKTLKKLRDLGNSVVVVEHDEDVIKSSDYVVDFGPYAGKHGGEIVAEGTLAEIIKNKDSITGKYLKNNKTNSFPSLSKRGTSGDLILHHCSQYNLKNITATFPINKLITVTGVSGSGKSTLVHDTLYGGVCKEIFGSYYGEIGKYEKITGAQSFKNVLLVDQSPIGRTPRSNPSTYTKVMDDIRKLMAKTIEAQVRGFDASKFSFNMKGGRCDFCDGQGVNKIEMQFLSDVYVTCEQCHGTRYKDEVLEVEYKGKNIAEILKLTVDEAINFFGNINSIRRKLETIKEVGLGYLQLGQASNTLSGGESQRLKISRELVKSPRLFRKTIANGGTTIPSATLYILDEPTTGLHFYDVEKLIKVLRKLVDNGNTVVLIEHNLDVIASSDWIIDLGPEGGEKGGEIIAQGTVQDIIKCKRSYTGEYLKKHS